MTWSFGLDSVEKEMGKIVNSHKNLRENTEKNFKNSLQNAKHALFATEVSRQQVAGRPSSREKHLEYCWQLK